MRSSSSQFSPSSFHLLLVDDNLIGLAGRQRVLRELGYRVSTAESGEEALELFAGLFEQDKFDLVVTDFRMSGITGVQLIAVLREKYPQVPIVLLSGFCHAVGLTEVNTGADAMLSKNANELTQLARTVRSLLTRKVTKKPPATERKSTRIRRTGTDL